MTAKNEPAAPDISIVIPVYNEEAILEAAVKDLIDRLVPFKLSYELILAENGSRDATVKLATQMMNSFLVPKRLASQPIGAVMIAAATM